MRGTGPFSRAYGIHGKVSSITQLLFCVSGFIPLLISEKYPLENHYDSFINSHGGSCNAQTEGEYTAYEFDVSSQYFNEALDIFAQCFLCPLLSVSSSDREVQAIENEFQLAKTNDSARLQQLFCMFASSGEVRMEGKHVLSKFSWGNKHSLQDIPSQLNVDMQSYLRGFHALHYTASNSRLCVCAPQSLDELQNLVTTVFDTWCSSIDGENNSTPRKKLRPDESSSGISAAPSLQTLAEACAPFVNSPPLPRPVLTTLTRVVPIETTHSLVMCFQLPPTNTQMHYRSGATRYLSHLIGHEGAGSLLSQLKNDMLAESLSAGVRRKGCMIAFNPLKLPFRCVSGSTFQF